MRGSCLLCRLCALDAASLAKVGSALFNGCGTTVLASHMKLIACGHKTSASESIERQEVTPIIIERPWLCYTILHYTVLYYTILYYTILYYTILYYTILYYTILYYTTLSFSQASPCCLFQRPLVRSFANKGFPYYIKLLRTHCMLEA